MKDSTLKNILVNIRTLFTENIRRRINENTGRITKLEWATYGMTARFHYLNLLDYYARHKNKAELYKKELDYLSQFGDYCVFPYQPEIGLNHITSGVDVGAKLPFVVHKNKKLFFKEDTTENEARSTYNYYFQSERLLGDEANQNAPHQYQSPRIYVTEGDVVFDIGAAEGLFALDQIDKASHIVIVESDPAWMEPLKHTFAPYSNKVTIIQKFVSATDTETTISLGKLLSDFDYESAFIKMDIEGFELPSLTSAKSVLSQKSTKLSIATYHKQHDAEELKAIFDSLGYYSEFSDGYMLFHLYDTPEPPYFRHGIIRATNKKKP